MAVLMLWGVLISGLWVLYLVRMHRDGGDR